MASINRAWWLLAVLAVAGCADPAKMKAFGACQSSVAAQNPDTTKPGEISIDVKHIEDVGNGMESCMTGFGYKYDESKGGCEAHPTYDARYYTQRSNAVCYTSTSGK